MKGWKTWTGVIGLVVVKLSTLFLDIDMDAADGTAGVIVQAVQAVLAALTVTGVAHKIEKAGTDV